MNGPNRKLTVALVVVGLLASSVALAAWGARAYQRNTIIVRVHEAGGTNISLALPGILLTTAVRLTPASVLVDHHCDDLADLAEALPYLQVAHRQLQALPDCQLVRIDSDDEVVRVAKEDGRLVVEVDTDDEQVYVAFPVGMLDSVVDKLAAIERRI